MTFVDPSGHPDCPGWPLRSYLALYFARCPVETVNVLALRGEWEDATFKMMADRSLLLQVGLDKPKKEPMDIKDLVGRVRWERNAQNVAVSRKVNLSAMMDPLTYRPFFPFPLAKARTLTTL